MKIDATILSISLSKIFKKLKVQEHAFIVSHLTNNIVLSKFLTHNIQKF